MAIQMKNHNQLTGGISIIRYKQHIAPMIGITEYLRKKLNKETMIKIKTNTKYRIS
jgi:hypothetical protein